MRSSARMSGTRAIVCLVVLGIAATVATAQSPDATPRPIDPFHSSFRQHPAGNDIPRVETINSDLAQTLGRPSQPTPHFSSGAGPRMKSVGDLSSQLSRESAAMRVERMAVPSGALTNVSRMETQMSDRVGLGGFSASGFGGMPTFSSPSLSDHYVARIEADNSAYTRLIRDTAVLNAAAEVADAAIGTAAGLHPWTSTAYNVGKVITSQTDLECGVAMLDQGTGHFMEGLRLGSFWTGVGTLRGLFKIRQSLDTFHDTVNQSFSNTTPLDMEFKDPFLNTRVEGFTTSIYHSSGIVGYDPGVDRVRRQIISNYSTMDTFTRGLTPSPSTSMDSSQNWSRAPVYTEPVPMQSTPGVDRTYTRPSTNSDLPRPMTDPDFDTIQPTPSMQAPIPPATTYQQPVPQPSPSMQAPMPAPTNYPQPSFQPVPSTQAPVQAPTTYKPPPTSVPQPTPSFRTEYLPPPSVTWR